MLQTLERIKRTVDKILVVIYYQADGESENSNLLSVAGVLQIHSR